MFKIEKNVLNRTQVRDRELVVKESEGEMATIDDKWEKGKGLEWRAGSLRRKENEGTYEKSAPAMLCRKSPSQRRHNLVRLGLRLAVNDACDVE